MLESAIYLRFNVLQLAMDGGIVVHKSFRTNLFTKVVLPRGEAHGI